MYKSESFTELSFNEIGFTKLGVYIMFYLYIDEILISSYHSFSEVRDFIFDFYLDVVKGVVPLEFYTKEMDEQMDNLIQGLICHQYEYFKIYGHEVQVYYGN